MTDLADADDAHLAQPRAALHLFDDAVLYTRYHEEGGTTSYPVDARDVVATLGQLPVGTGLLPRDTLFWSRVQGEERLARYVPARCWTLQSTVGTHRIPLPPFVFGGQGTAYFAFALKRYPRGPHEPLYRFPAANLSGGQICMGGTPMPMCTAATLDAALSLFLVGSRFNDHQQGERCRSHPTTIYDLWARLEGKRRFPLGELVPSRYTLDAISGLAR